MQGSSYLDTLLVIVMLLRILSLVALLVSCSVFIFLIGYRDQAEFGEASSMLASASSTPPSNSDPSLIISPIDTAIAERQRQWPIEREKLVKASYPLIKESSADVDGDGKIDNLYYRIRVWEGDFEGQLKITGTNRRVLWDHEFFMSKNDLAKFLAEVLEYENVTRWIENVFNENAPYAFSYEQTKLKASELHETQIDYAATLHKTPSKKLRDEILAQPTNHVFSYRAEWREDLIQIVYVPSLKQFVCYSRGY